jgi:hypothetical protein
MTTKITEDLLIAKQLAEKMKVRPPYVSAMKRCGYTFQFGRWTTYSHAMDWVRKHPWFRMDRAYPRKRKAERRQPLRAKKIA